jgi:hypothetical protein
MDARLEQELQAERIDGRKDWVRYVELTTAIHRAHVAYIEAELAPILDDLTRRRASAGLERELPEVGEARHADAHKA